VAEEGGAAIGALTYRAATGEIEIVTLNSAVENRGVGSALLVECHRLADGAGARLWLITTNDNLRAIAFYQRRGMDMVALHRDFVDVVRLSKPALATASTGEIPFRHAIEFEYPAPGRPSPNG
jgi:hypothetical protein